jgi:hypothetical protein
MDEIISKMESFFFKCVDKKIPQINITNSFNICNIPNQKNQSFRQSFDNCINIGSTMI